MKIELMQKANQTHAVVQGSMDALGIAKDRDVANRLVEITDKGLTLDLGAVTFLDASGLGLLTHLAKRLGRRLNLVNVHGQPYTFLQRLGLTKVFDLPVPTIAPTRDVFTFEQAA